MTDVDGKKRKRVSNGIVNAPNKKVAVESPQTGRIKVSYIDEDTLHPAIISTPGLNAPRVPFQAYVKSKMESSNGTIRPKTHELLLHSSEHPRLDYTASSALADQNLSHYVAVFDAATNNLSLAPAHSLRLQSSLRSETLEVQEQDKLTYAQQREELGREFGTKKAKKAILSKTENAITRDPKGKGKVTDVQSAILESVEGASAGAVGINVEQEADSLLASKPIPKPNLAAESAEEVYAFSNLIPPSDARLVNIKEWQDKARAEEEIKFNHRFPAFRVARIGKGDHPQKLKALGYIALLLDFHDALGGGKGGGRKVPKKEIFSKRLSGWPQALVDSVRRRFTNDTGSELGKWQMDNLYTHICALSLFVDGWATLTVDLKDDLKMEQRQLSQYFSELGCKVSAPTETEANARALNKGQRAVARMARLRLPLEFPKPRVGRRK